MHEEKDITKETAAPEENDAAVNEDTAETNENNEAMEKEQKKEKKLFNH